jgi:hypothetical protein
VSFSYRFSLQCTLVRPVPPDVVEWIESCRDGNPVAPRFEVSELAADMADQAGSLLADAAVDLSAWGHLSVQAVVHEAEGEGTYGLAMVLAPYCEEGTVGAMWTDMDPDVDPTLFFVQDGVLFVGNRNGSPEPAVGEDEPRVVWRLGTDAATVEEVQAVRPARRRADGPPCRRVRRAVAGSVPPQPVDRAGPARPRPLRSRGGRRS